MCYPTVCSLVTWFCFARVFARCVKPVCLLVPFAGRAYPGDANRKVAPSHGSPMLDVFVATGVVLAGAMVMMMTTMGAMVFVHVHVMRVVGLCVLFLLFDVIPHCFR